MKGLLIKATNFTPRISFDTKNNIFEISGDSFGNETLSFYRPVITWMGKYLQQNNRPIEFNIHMNYLNSSAFKRLNEILCLLENYHTSTQISVKVSWISNQDNDETLDYGDDVKEYFESLPIQLKMAA